MAGGVILLEAIDSNDKNVSIPSWIQDNRSCKNSSNRRGVFNNPKKKGKELARKEGKRSFVDKA